MYKHFIFQSYLFNWATDYFQLAYLWGLRAFFFIMLVTTAKWGRHLEAWLGNIAEVLLLKGRRKSSGMVTYKMVEVGCMNCTYMAICATLLFEEQKGKQSTEGSLRVRWQTRFLKLIACSAVHQYSPIVTATWRHRKHQTHQKHRWQTRLVRPIAYCSALHLYSLTVTGTQRHWKL